MNTIKAIAAAVRKELDAAVKDGDIDADSSWSEIAECLRQRVEPEPDWPKSMVEAEIVLVAQDMRP
jgi:hypothetical protein